MSHTVVISPSGHQFTVSGDEPLLEAALRQGVPLAYGCRSGNCGSCAGQLRSGEIAYRGERPAGLTAAANEQGTVLICQAHALSDLEIEANVVDAPAHIPIKTLPARVVTLSRLSHDVMLMELKLPASERLQFLAGQYLEILLKGGKARAFSIANPPHDDAMLQLHIRAVPGGFFTQQVFHELKEKALLRVRGPLGTFFLREDSDRPIILVAGGTGFAPVKAIIEHAVARGIQRPMHLFWGVRARRDLYLGTLAQSWADQNDTVRVTPVLSDPAPEDGWHGAVGLVHERVMDSYPDLSGFDAYLCGPPPMIAAARAAFIARGLPEDRLFYDSFEYSKDVRAALAHEPTTA
ncbi:MAG: CDP-6-deoxy-delta-3,4-glucoseen reductase [Thiotrichales bacterium]